MSLSFLLADGNTSDDIPLWLWRAFVSLCILIIAWFLKRDIDAAKDANKSRDTKIEKLIVVTAAHEVMYELWLEEIASGGGHFPHGTRKTDQLHRMITQIAEAKKE